MKHDVLIVEDSAVVRTMIKKSLRLAGIEVGACHEGGNGQEGLAQLERHGASLVLANLNMPVMGGLEMIRKIRERPEFKDLPIVVISSESSRPRIAALARQGVGFVHKPFAPERLGRLIRDAIGGGHDADGGSQGTGTDRPGRI